MGEIISNIYTNPYENRITVTVDLSSSQFRAVAALVDENGGVEKILAVASVASAGMSKGFISNAEEAGKKLDELKKKISCSLSNLIFKDMLPGEPKPIVVIRDCKVSLSGNIISRHISKSRNLNGERISQAIVGDLYEQVKNTLASEKNDVFSINTLEYNVDDEDTMTPVGAWGNNLISGRYLVLESKDIARENANWALGNVDSTFVLNNEALAEVVLSDYDKECGCVLLDMGSCTTTVSVYHNKLLRHYRVLPFGGNVLTNDIKEVLAVSSGLAEELKKAMGFATANADRCKGYVCVPKGEQGLTEEKMINVKELARIIEARVEEFLGFIEGEAYDGGVPNNFKMILSGGATKLNRFKDKVKSFTGRDAEFGQIKQEYVDKYGKYFNKTNEISDFSVCLGLLSGKFVSSVSFEKAANVVVERPKQGKKNKFNDWGKKIYDLLINDEDETNNA